MMSEMIAGNGAYLSVPGVAVVVLLLLWLVFRRRPARTVMEEPDVGEDDSELMGKAKLEEGVEILSSEELNFSPKVMQPGDVPDLQQEIREICQLLSEKDGNKEEFIALLRLAVENYPKIPSDLHGALSAFVREVSGFHLSDEELESLWL